MSNFTFWVPNYFKPIFMSSITYILIFKISWCKYSVKPTKFVPYRLVY
jgi:hypothetical protein